MEKNMNHIFLIPKYQRKKTIPKRLKNLELMPLNEDFGKLTKLIVGDDELRPVMMYNFFDVEEKLIISTDAHKLTTLKMPNETFDFVFKNYSNEIKENNGRGVILKTIQNLEKEYNELVKIAEKNKSVDLLQNFDDYAKMRIVEDGRYPQYKPVFPNFENNIFSKEIDYAKLFWYCQVLKDAKILRETDLSMVENNLDYQNGKIDYLKDSYVSFLNRTTNKIILKYTANDSKIEYISFNAKMLSSILRFAIEFNGKYSGLITLFSRSKPILLEFEKGTNILNNDSVGLCMPIIANDFETIGDMDIHDTYYMYYDLDNNTILSGTKIDGEEDFGNFEIDETCGYINKNIDSSKVISKTINTNVKNNKTLFLISDLEEVIEYQSAKDKIQTKLLIADLKEILEFA